SIIVWGTPGKESRAGGEYRILTKIWPATRELRRSNQELIQGGQGAGGAGLLLPQGANHANDELDRRYPEPRHPVSGGEPCLERRANRSACRETESDSG